MGTMVSSPVLPLAGAAAPAPCPKGIRQVPIRMMSVRHRRRILRHLLALDAHDRYLRFGYPASDAQIQGYVQGIDFERDALLGIFNRRLQLIAMAHLAYPPNLAKAGFAEFGVSVNKPVRGRGYGAQLFERAALRALNDGADTLYIHALSENAAMLHIARRAGAVIERAGSESEAHLHLPEASFRSRLDQLLANQVGHVDYWFKREAVTWTRVLALVQEVREGVGAALRRTGR